jgi:hypothetical protein
LSPHKPRRKELATPSTSLYYAQHFFVIDTLTGIHLEMMKTKMLFYFSPTDSKRLYEIRKCLALNALTRDKNLELNGKHYM